MLNLLILIIVTVVILAIINWKFPRGRARYFAVFPIVSMYFIARLIIVLPSRGYPFPWLIIAVMANFILPLAFFADDYIQYKKDKTNIENIKKTLNSALFYLVCNLLVSIILVYHFLVYFY